MCKTVIEVFFDCFTQWDRVIKHLLSQKMYNSIKMLLVINHICILSKMCFLLILLDNRE